MTRRKNKATEREEGRLFRLDNNNLILYEKKRDGSWGEKSYLNFEFGTDRVIFEAISKAFKEEASLFLVEYKSSYYFAKGEFLKVLDLFAKVWETTESLPEKLRMLEETQLLTNLETKNYSLLIEKLGKFLLKIKLETSKKRR